MTGEMNWNDLKNGNWDYMINLTKVINESGIRAELRPYDQYIGAYIALDFKGKPFKSVKYEQRIGQCDAKVWTDEYINDNCILYGIDYKSDYIIIREANILDKIKELRGDQHAPQ